MPGRNKDDLIFLLTKRNNNNPVRTENRINRSPSVLIISNLADFIIDRTSGLYWLSSPALTNEKLLPNRSGIQPKIIKKIAMPMIILKWRTKDGERRTEFFSTFSIFRFPFSRRLFIPNPAQITIIICIITEIIAGTLNLLNCGTYLKNKL